MRKLSESPKTILMVDHEPLMIDRRILLEGKTLLGQGYKVVLVTRGDGIKPDKENIGGIEVRRFVDPWLLNHSNRNDVTGQWGVNKFQQILARDRQLIHGWINSPVNIKLEESVRARLVFLPRKLQTFFYALVWPPIMAAILRKGRFGIPLKSLLGRSFEPLVFLMLFQPIFLLPYFRLLIWRIKNYIFPSVESTLSEKALSEGWQFELEKFSIDLKPDLVHAHDLPNLSIGKRIAEHLGIPLIYDAHELYPMQYISNEGHRKELFELERRLIPHVDGVIAVNRQCADFLESTYLINGVVPLTNATESPENFNPSERLNLWHERFNLPEDVKIMVFQGGINPIRNIDQLIKALTGLPDFIHVGFITYAKDVPYYEDLSRELGVFDRVHYVIEIPWDEVVYWLASSDVGIMPYQATNYNAQISSPNKLYEFVVAGIPIIGSTELINVKHAIELDGLGLATLLREVDSYQKIIFEMFNHPEGPNRFKKNVLSARGRYTWSSEESKLIALYEKIFNPSYKAKALQKKNLADTACVE